MASSIRLPQSASESFDSVGPKLSPNNANTVSRRHDLDALRAVAMLLGIVLHAALAYTTIPWAVQDAQPGTLYEVLFAVIHGFRMPLFFLISGFFTAMLWRKRGLGGFIHQRLRRIVVPLVVGCVTIVPAMWGVTMLASQSSSTSDLAQWFDAAAAGDTEKVRRGILSHAVTVDALHPASGASLLTVATFCDQTETVRMLLAEGADVHQRNRDTATALHAAVFMGRVEAAKLLIEAGADPELKDGNGKTPKDNLVVDFGTTSFIAQMFGQSLDEATLTSNRAEIAKLFGEDQSQAREALSSGAGTGALYGLLFQLPVYMHLWFLAFLCWLVSAFVLYALLARRVNFGRIPKWLFCSPLALIWLVPLTMIPQSFMMPATFGSDPSIGLLPIPSVLGYYAIFFFFGVIYWELDDRKGLLGNGWYITLPVALFIVFPLGLELVAGTFGFLSLEMGQPLIATLGNLLEALFAWMMVFGSIGMFRALLSSESKVLRYVSDSSYWLYLAHLPLVILAQWLVKDLPIPALAKFLGIIVVVSVVLLLTYEYFVRYTLIGRTLNGPRERVAGGNLVDKETA